MYFGVKWDNGCRAFRRESESSTASCFLLLSLRATFFILAEAKMLERRHL